MHAITDRPTGRTGAAPWGVAALLFFLVTMFGHDMVGQACVAVFEMYGRSVMESRLRLFSGVLLGAFCLWSLWRMRRAWTARRIAGALYALSLTATADALFVSTSVERIHYAQYALLAMLLRRWSGSGTLALVLCGVAGAVDELWQYAAFPWYTKYLDFNDMVLNVAGAALGLLLAPPRDGGALSARALRRAWSVTGAAGIAAASSVGALAATGFFAPSVAPDGAPQSVFTAVGGTTRFVLSYHGPLGRWAETAFGRTYYILDWAQGSALALAACAATAALLPRREWG